MKTSLSALKRSQIFKDQAKLSFDFVPDELPGRKKEMDKLGRLFRPVIYDQMSQTALIIGPVGSGKTAVVKRFCSELEEAGIENRRRITYVHVNCRNRKSESMVLLSILNHFDPRFPDRGFSIPEMIEILKKHLKKKEVHLVIVLDEADVLLKRSGSDLVYSFTRVQEEDAELLGAISLIMISQKSVVQLMDRASLSTFKRTNIIEFGKYDREVLSWIVDQRIELAFHPGIVDESVSEMIAAMSEEYGDARFAIELLEKAGMATEERGDGIVGPEHARWAKAEVKPFVFEETINQLNVHEQIMLLSASRLLKKSAYCSTGELEVEYKALCEQINKRPLGHTQFWQYMKEMDAFGLISTKRSGKGTVGNTTLITIQDVPVVELIDYLEKVLLS
ncbi:MAG: AAA family ATPase [Candidatus Thermoplasmatota archaeon]|nr:AAA family ATPase [Candidatus Thermoplasmatota archaeon]